MDAEQRLRDFLTKQGTSFSDLRKLSYTQLDAFSLVRSDGKAVNAVVAGDHVWVDEHSLDVVGKVLAARKFLDARDLAANDLIFLVTAFGTVPREIAGFGSYRQTKNVPGYPAQLEHANGGANLDLVIPRESGRRGTTPDRTQTVHKARLAVSPSYGVSWTVEESEVPTPATS